MLDHTTSRVLDGAMAAILHATKEEIETRYGLFRAMSAFEAN